METISGIVIGLIVGAALVWFFLFRSKGEGAGELEAPRQAEPKPPSRAAATKPAPS